MMFNDNFPYNEQQIEEVVLRAFLIHIKKTFTKHGSDDSTIKVSGAGLIESALTKLGLKNFDFVNGTTKAHINKALVDALRFLVEQGLISSDFSHSTKFYNHLIKRELFKPSEFSNAFEQDLVLNLMNNLEFSLYYNVYPSFHQFYGKTIAYTAMATANKIIKINIPLKPQQRILVLPVHINDADILKALEEDDFSEIATYIANPNITHDHVTLYSTTKDFDHEMQHHLTSVCNTDEDIKKEVFDTI